MLSLPPDTAKTVSLSKLSAKVLPVKVVNSLMRVVSSAVTCALSAAFTELSNCASVIVPVPVTPRLAAVVRK